MKKALILLVLITGVASASIVLAAPPGSPYSPGETLDPSCAPASTNCTVAGAVSEVAATVQTTNGTGTVLYSIPVSQGTAVDVEIDLIALDSDESDRYLFDYKGLFYRNTGGNVTQQGTTINLGGPILSSDVDILFGDNTSQYDITTPVPGTTRYTWDGTGTDPNFASNGLTVGATVSANSPMFHPANNGSFPVTAVTDDYYEVMNNGFIQTDITSVTISVSISPTINFIANTGTQSVDLTVFGLSGVTLNWKGIIRSFAVSN